MKNLIYPLVILLVIGYFIGKQVIHQKSKGLEKAPDFSAELIDGTEIKLSELQGNYVLLDFWGSWCGPCRTDIPKIVTFNQNYNNQIFKDADDFLLVTVALEKTPEAWKTVAKRYNFDWHHQIVQQNKFVMLSPIARKFGVTEIPAKFLIGPKGDVLAINDLKKMQNILDQQLK